jgi:hypothetical protein
MSGRKPSSKGLGKVNPDDFFNYEEQYIGKTSGGSGAKAAGQKGDKTLRDLKKQQWKASLENRQSELESAIRLVLDGFPDFETDLLRDQFLEKYVAWVVENLASFKPLDPAQIEISFSKSGGPGGQNINKRETRVAVLHKPTRTRVVNDQTRSQVNNRELAMEQILKRLQDHVRDWKMYLGPGQRIDLNLVRELQEREL